MVSPINRFLTWIPRWVECHAAVGTGTLWFLDGHTYDKKMLFSGRTPSTNDPIFDNSNITALIVHLDPSISVRSDLFAAPFALEERLLLSRLRLPRQKLGLHLPNKSH